jgi:hypothetical protein
MAEEEPRSFGHAQAFTNAERLKSLLAAREVWERAGFEVSEAMGDRFPIVLLENKTTGVRLEIDTKAVFSKAPTWSPVYGFKLPYFTITLEQGPEFGAIKKEWENRFFSIESRDKFLFPNAPKFSRARDWKLPTLVFRPNSDPFGLKRDVQAFLDETSKLAVKEVQSLVETIMEAGAKLTRPKAAYAPSTHRASEHPKKDGALTEFAIGETYPKTVKALVDHWKKKGITRPNKNLILTMSEGHSDILNRLAQRERLKAGLLGPDSIRIKYHNIHRHDRVRLTKSSSFYGVSEGDTGTVTKVTSEKLSIFLDSGHVVRLSPKHYEAIELGYAMTHASARHLSTRRAFIMFEGVSPASELNEIRRRDWSSQVHVYAQTTAAERAFRQIEKEEEKRRNQAQAHVQEQSNEHENDHDHTQ